MSTPAPRLIITVVVTVLLALAPAACARHDARSSEPGLAELRRRGPSAEDPELAARWLLSELLAQGGEPRQARRARERLDFLKSEGMLPSFSRGLDDSLHGALADAPGHFLRAVRAARGSDDPRAPMIAWFAVQRALELRTSRALWREWKPFVENALADPGHLGWRARIELVEWWIAETYKDAARDLDEIAARHLGCAEHIALAGPFGTGTRADLVRRHPPEEPGPWPQRWTVEPGEGLAPHVLAIKQRGCFVYADEPTRDGVYYAQTFVELDRDREVLLAVQGALALWVDDALVLERDPRVFGIWPKFGVQLRLTRGRHRILARLDAARTSVRLMSPDGRPLGAPTNEDASVPYVLTPPQGVGEPNYVSRWVRDGKVLEAGDVLTQFLVAQLAYAEGQGDLASVALQPLVRKLDAATGPVLLAAAQFTSRDPVYARDQARDLARELSEHAFDRDPGLWRAELDLARWEIERSGPTAAVKGMRALADRYPQVPAVQIALAELYGSLGWNAEYAKAATRLAERFPDSVPALSAALEVYDQQGLTSQADALVERIRGLDGDSEVLLTRALEREEYGVALAELKRLAKRRPDREDIAERIYDVMVRAGNAGESWKKLEAAIAESPKSGAARLSLADLAYAGGRHDALRRALVEATQSGASTGEIESALDLVEGMSELEPYRLAAQPIIDAYERSGRNMPGHAARVLDYSAIWVKSDGSSRMLEHEVVRIQSAEAISKMAEQRMPAGLVLHVRVIKRDGRVFEPELVPGKPTLTLPHVEVGDYIETEHIISMPGDGRHGMSYEGPHWFFREENVAYARSEFVVITPKDKPLVIETHGDVPPPEVHDLGALLLRRWRVDASPAAPSEPYSAPITEFLPSVRVGWGVSLEQRLRRFSDLAKDLTPIDPRVTEIAERIVKPLPPGARSARAKRLYRWVLDNVEDGEETDGRRVIIGKQGHRARAFETLCRALRLDVEYAVAKSRLAPPPVGPLERAALFGHLLMRVQGDRGPVWLTVGDKFAPFGYVPAEVRGMPAYVMAGRAPERVTVPASGSLDGVEYEGKVDLRPDGSARIELVQRYLGSHSVAARNQLEQLPESRLPDVLQSMIGQMLRGGRLVKHEVSRLDDLDTPLLIRMTVDVDAFAQREGDNFVLAPPFPALLGGLATLPTRQTPLLVATSTYRKVNLQVSLPPGSSVLTELAPIELKSGDRVVRVRDRVEKASLFFDRLVIMPAGRVKPPDYVEFVRFARRADDVQTASVRIKLAR